MGGKRNKMSEIWRGRSASLSMLRKFEKYATARLLPSLPSCISFQRSHQTHIFLCLPWHYKAALKPLVQRLQVAKGDEGALAARAQPRLRFAVVIFSVFLTRGSICAEIAYAWKNSVALPRQRECRVGVGARPLAEEGQRQPAGGGSLRPL